MIKNLLVACTLALCAASASAADDNAALQAEIQKLDQAHAKAIFEGDAKALDLLMDDDVTVNHPTGKIVKEKKELLSMIAKGVIRYTRFERTPEKFLFFPDMVVVMGGEIVTQGPTAPNPGKTQARRYTNVWMKKDGVWKLTLRHANNVCDCQ